MDHPGNRTIIYVPDGPERDLWERLAVDYCQRHQYQIVSLVVGRASDDGWADVIALLRGDVADLVVVGRLDQLPPDRLPRVEVIAEH